MYLQGKLTIDLTDTHIDMRPPRNFFGGLANLLTRGHWGTPEAMETYNRTRQSTPISTITPAAACSFSMPNTSHHAQGYATRREAVESHRPAGRKYRMESQAGTEHGELLQPTSEVQEEAHISRTAGGVKLIFGETSLEHNMVTERPVDSQDGLNDTFIKNRESMLKGSGITA